MKNNSASLTGFENYQPTVLLLGLKRRELKDAESAGDAERAAALSSAIADLTRTLRSLERAADSWGADDPRSASERLFLRCRYIHGMTMEETAAELHVSRDTAFRIKRRMAQRNGGCGGCEDTRLS